MRTNEQIFYLNIDNLGLGMIFRLLVILQLPQELSELLVPSRMVILLSVLQRLVFVLTKLISISTYAQSPKSMTDLESIVFPLKFPAQLLKLVL